MRIGLFTDQYYPSISGVVTSLKMLYEGLTDLGHEVFIFTSFAEEMIDNPEELKRINVINIPGVAYPFKNLKSYRFTFKNRKYAKIIGEYKLDIIHIHTEFSIAKIAKIAGKMFNIPIVHTLHTLYEDYIKYVSPFMDRHFHDAFVSFATKIIIKPISKASVIEIVPTKKVLAVAKKYQMFGEIRVIPTGIQLQRFYSSNFTKEQIKELKNKLMINDDMFVYGYIGRTSAEKNIELIIKAFSQIKDKNNAVLVIVGGGPELEGLKKLAENVKILDKVIFTGFVEWENIPLYYQVFDVFVNASKSETQGLTYIEALSSSVPLLVQKDDCISDVVQDYYNGIYFDGEDELIVKMEEIKSNPDILKKIRLNTQKSVAKYSKEQYAINVEKVYNDAIEKYKENKKK